MSETELDTFDAIFWCDVGQFGGDDVRKLDAHLRRGGGFFVALGEKSAENLGHYNELLFKNEQGILPARLMKRIVAAGASFLFAERRRQRLLHRAPRSLFRRRRQAGPANGPLPPVRGGDRRGRQSADRALVHAGSSEHAKVKLAKLPINAPALIEWQPPLSLAVEQAARQALLAKAELASIANRHAIAAR